MKTLNPSDVASAWVSGMSGASEKVKRGVAAVNESPTAAAARAVDFWQSQVSSDQARQKYIRGLGRVSLEEWRTQMMNKGVSRMGAGAQAARSKFESFMSEFLPFVQSVSERVRQMPKNSLEDRIQRMVEQVRQVSQFRRSR